MEEGKKCGNDEWVREEEKGGEEKETKEQKTTIERENRMVGRKKGRLKKRGVRERGEKGKKERRYEFMVVSLKKEE